MPAAVCVAASVVVGCLHGHLSTGELHYCREQRRPCEPSTPASRFQMQLPDSPSRPGLARFFFDDSLTLLGCWGVADNLNKTLQEDWVA
eukprot:917564-Amphidinium_carterae.2